MRPKRCFAVIAFRAAGSFGTLSSRPFSHGSHSYICDTCASIASIFLGNVSSIATATSGANGFESLGQFRFAPHAKGTVLYRVAGARGTVHVDAVQVVPVKTGL